MQERSRESLDFGTDGSLLGLWIRRLAGYEWRDDLSPFAYDQDGDPQPALSGVWVLVPRDAPGIRNGQSSVERYPLQREMPHLLGALDDLALTARDDSELREVIRVFADRFGLLGFRFYEIPAPGTAAQGSGGLTVSSVPFGQAELFDEWRGELVRYGWMRRLLKGAAALRASKGAELYRRPLHDLVEGATAGLHTLYGPPPPPDKSGPWRELEWAREVLARAVDSKIGGHLLSSTRPGPGGSLRFMPDSLLTAVYMYLGMEVAEDHQVKPMSRCPVCRQVYPLTRKDRDFCSRKCWLQDRRARQRSGGIQ